MTKDEHVSLGSMLSDMQILGSKDSVRSYLGAIAVNRHKDAPMAKTMFAGLALSYTDGAELPLIVRRYRGYFAHFVELWERLV